MWLVTADTIPVKVVNTTQVTTEDTPVKPEDTPVTTEDTPVTLEATPVLDSQGKQATLWRN